MKISVVTVNYNDSEGLTKTITSYKNQLIVDKELIVVDGASTDSSIDVIKDNVEFITNWISEKDEGIYDAMNKGINYATGDFLIFMNSGDIFYSNKTLGHFQKNVTDYSKVYFGRAKIYADKFNQWHYPSFDVNKGTIDKWLLSNLPNHQAMFFPRDFYKNQEYSLKYKISSDADYKFRAKNQNGLVFVDDVICEFYTGGVSSNFKSLKKVKLIARESKEILLKYRSRKKAYIRVINIYIKFILSCFGNRTLNFILSLYRKK